MENDGPALTEEIGYLKYALKAKDEYLANVSHELRSPLNTVIGFSEVLASQEYGALNDKQKDYVGRILAGGKRLLSLINNVLDLAKMDAMRSALNAGEVSMKDLVQGVLVIIKESAFRREINVSSEFCDNADKVTADEKKLKHVVYNILSNAVKFTPQGGAVKVVVRKKGPAVEFEASDTGQGISADRLETIFMPFSRQDAAGTDESSGTGLSMAVSKKIIEMHGGRIWAESEGPGKGASFKFTIPAGN